MRCTCITRSNSSRVMFLKVRSRRMPALFTRMSMRPKAAMASSAMLLAPSRSATDALLAMAAPPNPAISATTASAASPAPVPSTPPPRSFTTTFAPRLANSIAWQRPMPPPAPVTIATLPLNSLSAFTVDSLMWSPCVPLGERGLAHGPASPQSRSDGLYHRCRILRSLAAPSACRAVCG